MGFSVCLCCGCWVVGFCGVVVSVFAVCFDMTVLDVIVSVLIHILFTPSL